MFEIFEHTADMGLRVRAESLDQLFTNAARGLFSIMVVNLDGVEPVQERTYDITGDETDLLLFDWLSELLYTFDTERLLLSEFNVQVNPTGLTAICRGEPMNTARHEMDHEVKAITYHELKVNQTNEGWVAELIVDI